MMRRSRRVTWGGPVATSAVTARSRNAVSGFRGTAGRGRSEVFRGGETTAPRFKVCNGAWTTLRVLPTPVIIRVDISPIGRRSTCLKSPT